MNYRCESAQRVFPKMTNYCFKTSYQLNSDLSLVIIQLLLSAEFSRPVSAMCENHDGLSHRSISEQRRLHSPSVDEQETELEPSLEQDEEDKDQEQDRETEQDHEGNITPSRKKEIMVVKIS